MTTVIEFTALVVLLTVAIFVGLCALGWAVERWLS
jgi:Flp pilus assembly pilin Flp